MFKKSLIKQLSNSYTPNSIAESYGLGSHIDDISDDALLAVLKEAVNKLDTCQPLKYGAESVPIVAKEGAECMLFITEYDELNKYASSEKISTYDALVNVCECNNIDVDSIAVYISGNIIKESFDLVNLSKQTNDIKEKSNIKLELYSAYKNLSELKENGIMIFKEGFIKNFINKKKKEKEDMLKSNSISQSNDKLTLTTDQIAIIKKILKESAIEVLNRSDIKKRISDNISKTKKDYNDNTLKGSYIVKDISESNQECKIQIFKGNFEIYGTDEAYNKYSQISDLICQLAGERCNKELSNIKFNFDIGNISDDDNDLDIYYIELCQY